MSLINDIKKLLSEELKEFEQVFKASLKTEVSILDKITRYIVKRKGKQMRPMFVLLTGRMFGELSPSVYRAASLVELLHTATLVHDDVVDDAMERRGFFSINAIWKNKISVLVGDFLLSRSLIISVKNREFEVLRSVTEAVQAMSEGELLQIEKSRKMNQDESVYYEIIRQKTASLIAACCESGAISAGASEEDSLKMKDFGEAVGMAFQIKDDLFDYQSSKLTGKASFTDLKEKKLTLPVIHALQNCSSSERKKWLRIIGKRKKQNQDYLNILQFVKDHNGITYSKMVMQNYADKALNILKDFPDNEYKDHLYKLVTYTIKREK